MCRILVTKLTTRLSLVTVLWLSCPSAFADQPAHLDGIRVGTEGDRLRVVFDLSSQASFETTILEAQSRVILDLAVNPSIVQIPILPRNNDLVEKVSVDGEESAKARFVFETNGDLIVNTFTLRPYMGRGNRIVIDFEPRANTDLRKFEVDTQTPDISAVNEEPPQMAPSIGAQLPIEQNPKKRDATKTDSYSEWSSQVSLQARLFPESPAYPEQRDQDASLAFRSEYFLETNGGRDEFSFIPFARIDSSDSKRTHADIRALYWRRQYEDWVVKAGVDVVFWGVTESQHLVDIINQTDLVEDIDGEEKLGQPMLNLDYLSDWGTWQIYVLPYFRERTYPGKHGRLRTEPPVDVNDPVYQSDDKQKHVDYAIRWSHYFGNWDIGLAHFSGTIRDPFLLLDNTREKQRFLPLYVQIEQTSLDIQSTQGAWLWKLEAIYNQNKFENYYAYTGGFEYTQFGIADSVIDLGWLLEYNYDERGRRSINVLQRDIYFGIRLAANDIASSSLLAGVVVDTDHHSTFLNIEGARRLSDTWLLSFELRAFANIEREDAFFFLRADDYLGIELTRYF